MLSLFTVILMFYVTGKLAMFSIRAGWSILKIMISVVFLPIIILGTLIGGLIHLAIPVLVIIGIITLVKELTGRGGYGL